ncbi:PLP-dependent transferase [Xylariaceae sp. FL0804]|nr:PLP-dependent transferase [Xylariaceae sp. FL0804]
MTSRRAEYLSTFDYARGSKDAWDPKTNPGGIVSYGNAENYLMHDVLKGYLEKKGIATFQPFNVDLLGYHEGFTGTTELLNAMAAYMNSYFRPASPISPDNITLANGGSSINELIATVLTDPGDSLLIGSTIYSSFNRDLVMRTNASLEYVTFGSVDQFSPEAVPLYEKAYLAATAAGKTVKALVLCNPHNPTGHVYPASTLKAFLVFAEKHSLHIYSDEIYAHSMYTNAAHQDIAPFTSILSLVPDSSPMVTKVHVLSGMSKDFAAAGLRLGALVSRNGGVTAAVRALCRFAAPSELSMAVWAAMLRDAGFLETYFAENTARLGREYRRSVALLDELGIPYVQGGTAGFFIWLRLGKFLPVGEEATVEERWAAEKELSDRFTRARVVLAYGRLYHAEEPGQFRLVFTLGWENTVEGLRRICEVVGIEFRDPGRGEALGM